MPPPPEIPNWQPLSSCRVLLGEDVAAVRNMYAAALRKEGATVETAADGAAVIRACEAAAAAGSPYSAVVLDYVMPGMNGAEVTAALRSNGYEGMIVGLSAELSDEETKRWRAAGCDEVLRKGVFLSSIVARVATACSRRAGGQNLGSQRSEPRRPEGA